MHSIRGLFSAGILAFANVAVAQLHFETDATLHDYPSLSDGRGKYNPPWCEVSYESLDLNSVTAYCSIDKSSCGACLQVCGSVGCKYLLAIDQCSRGDGQLDISTGAGMEICGSDTGHHQVTATQVDAAKCEHIWNGKMFFDYATPYGGLATLESLIQGGQPAATTPAPEPQVPDFTATANVGTPSAVVNSQPEPVSVNSAPAGTLAPTVPDEVPPYSLSQPALVTPVNTNQPWSVPSATAFTVVPPFGNSSSYSNSSSALAAIPTYDGSNTETNAGPGSNGSGGLSTTGSTTSDSPVVTGLGGEFGETKSACSGVTTSTVTVPGSTVYVTVTSVYSNGNGDGNSNSQPSTTEGVLAETAAGDSTTKSTTTLRMTTTVWTTRTTTVTGCPAGFTNCPSSLQSTGLTTQVTPTDTTPVPSAAPSIPYAGGPGVWNGTQPGSTHGPIDIPNAAAASAGAYVAEVKARNAMAAPMPHAKRSAASGSTGNRGWETLVALSGITVLFVVAF